MSLEFKNLQRRQIDHKLSELGSLTTLSIPREGWIKTIRNALGMPAEELGERVNISQSAVTQFEKKEAEGGISLNSLKKLANGMECDFFYAMIPKTSISEMLERQARKHAERIVHAVAQSMALENQDISIEEKERQIEELTKKFQEKPIPDIWRNK